MKSLADVCRRLSEAGGFLTENSPADYSASCGPAPADRSVPKPAAAAAKYHASRQNIPRTLREVWLREGCKHVLECLLV